MKLLLVAALAVCAFGRSLNDDVALFADFRATYGRSYAPTEEAHRFDCFRKTLSSIDELNAREPHATFGINAFSDLCADEFKAMYHNARPSNYTGPRRSFPVKAPTPVDWRQKGAVTHVKNQAQCGSCWTFSAVGNLEGQHFLNGGGKLVGLSEEELVQCAKSAGNGCQGGWMDKAIEWVVQNGGIDSESDYPYTSGHGVNGRCNEEKAAKHVATFSKMSHIAQNEAEIASALNSIGPLSIGVDAQSGWQSYRGGVMTTCRGTSIDHGVTLVGYGGTGEGYWIVKNSWGTSWGESGYIRLAYGSDQCGMRQTVATGHV